LSLSLFARGRKIAQQRGLILADTKYEFGFDEQGVSLLPTKFIRRTAAVTGWRIAMGNVSKPAKSRIALIKILSAIGGVSLRSV